MNTSKQGMSFYQKALIIVAVILIIVGIWHAYTTTPVATDMAMNDTMATGTMATMSAPMATTSQVQAESYTNKAHLFQIAYTSDWEPTTIFNVGAYASAIAFVPVSAEPTLAADIHPNSTSITAAAEDHAVFFRVENNSSINAIVSSLYGNGVVVSNAVVNGKNVAHIVHSKSSDPTNWQGGSTEAYIFRNTLGEAIVVEANYSSPEPQTSGPLYTEFQTMVSSMVLLSQ